ncbi:hypothetical protein AB1L05_04555 [Cytobacillus horneckiae]|uniref:hypothetical protein n=1 Tax=Cytobacillus horneckiae TaxID=549687 RepID=UPI0039A0E760
MTVEEILEHSKDLIEEDILKVIAKENYGIVFIRNEEYEEDMTNLYRVMAKFLYKEAKREAALKRNR